MSLMDLLLLDRPPNQEAVLERISARRESWFWGSAQRAAKVLFPGAGACNSLLKLKPAHRRISVAELEGHVNSRPYRLRVRRVYTRSHDITEFDLYMLY